MMVTYQAFTNWYGKKLMVNQQLFMVNNWCKPALDLPLCNLGAIQGRWSLSPPGLHRAVQVGH